MHAELGGIVDDPVVDGAAGPSLAGWLSARAPGTGDDDMAPAAIGDLLDEMAAHPELVARAAALRPAPGGRSWDCIYRDAHLDVWTIAWRGGSDTGWHDHDLSSGAFRVLEGAVVQERPRWGGDHEWREVPAGECLSFGPDHVHRLAAPGGWALTVHAYSPPLRRMGQYTVDADGAVRRRIVGAEEELRDLAS